MPGCRLTSGARARARNSSLRRLALNEPRSLLVTNPAGGFACLHPSLACDRTDSPTSFMTTSRLEDPRGVRPIRIFSARGVSVSPALPSRTHASHRIECRDYSKAVALGLLRQASVELDEPVSGHPARRVTVMVGSDAYPLSPVGSRVYRVTMPRNGEPTTRLVRWRRRSITRPCSELYQYNRQPSRCRGYAAQHLSPHR